jgi:Low-density lipoprotein receptor domain class A
MRSKIGLALTMALVGPLLATCGSGDSSYCERAVSKMESCGLLAKGSGISTCTEPKPKEICNADCMLGASCADLTVLFCHSNGSATAFEACTQNCEAKNRFTCKDGLVISGDSKCNGVQDCSDGSDEAGCPTFTCRDGSKVSLQSKCNGYEDCSDGSDEVGCPTFTCDNGSTVAQDARCNGVADCPDYSDESGCPQKPQFICK